MLLIYFKMIGGYKAVHIAGEKHEWPDREGQAEA